jgi:hypothetical protein
MLKTVFDWTGAIIILAVCAAAFVIVWLYASDLAIAFLPSWLTEAALWGWIAYCVIRAVQREIARQVARQIERYRRDDRL